MNAQRVLVVGDANLDLVLQGDVAPRFGQAEQLLDAADLTLGGSAALVAHGLARLGVPVGLCAAVGEDAFGERTLAILEAAGVDTAPVVRRPAGATGLSVILSPSGGDRAILTHLGVLPTLMIEDLPPLDGVTHLHVASPYLVTGLRADLPLLLRRAVAEGASTSLDTNDDPARAWDLLGELLPAADVVLPNRDEVGRWAAVLGLAATTWEEAAQAVAELGPDVVVKAGADGGALFRAGRSPILCAAQPTTPVDTTGAGDSFDAGWIAARVAGADERVALSWAVTAGSLSTRAAGGSGAQPDHAELVAAAERPAER